MQLTGRAPWLPAALGLATALLASTVTPGASAAPAGPGPAALAAPSNPGQITTIPDWRMRSTAAAGDDGTAVSRPEYADTGWLTVPARSTVMAGLIANHRYPDLNYSTNLRDEVNAADFRVPWWYRRSFTADPASGRHTFLQLEGGIIAKAEIWLNGSRVTGTDEVAGAYPAHEYDVTGLLRAGANVVAVKAFPADTKRDLVISFLDWSRPTPDNNMGIWRDVRLAANGAVSVRNPRVVTSLALPTLEHADLTVRAEVRNNSGQPVTTQLAGTVDAVRFEQTVTLRANETRTISFSPKDFPQLHIIGPRVWWPFQMGQQALYQLTLDARVGGALSDTGRQTFGIRDVRSTLNSSGARSFTVNGTPFLVRGGGWAPDLFLRTQPRRLADQLRYVRDLGLNTIRMEGKEETAEMYDLADRMGIMLMPGWECCSSWEQYGKWTDADRAVATASAETEARRLRNHPSVLGFYLGSDSAPPAEVERGYLDAFRTADWQVPLIPSAAKHDTAQLGASGMKMDGPYWWIPPNYWYGDRLGGAFGFASEVGPGPTIPEIDSLKRFLSPSELEDLWKNQSKEQYHLNGKSPFNTLSSFGTALSRRYGPATGLEDFVRKSQLANYEVNRAQFEAFGKNQSRTDNPSTGVIYWMLNNAWPTLYWHLFDHQLEPAGSYFGAKTALRPLHVQYAYDDRSVSLVNTGLNDTSGLSVQTTVFNLDGTVKSDETRKSLTAKGNTTVMASTVSTPGGLSETYFVRLLLRDASGHVVDRNVYWLSTQPDVLAWDRSTWYDTPVSTYADLTALQNLKRGKLVVSAVAMPTNGDTVRTTVTLVNTGTDRTVDFFLHATIRGGQSGPEIVPVTWSQNYVTLWPGEHTTITAEYRGTDLGDTMPWVEVSGVNVTGQQVAAL